MGKGRWISHFWTPTIYRQVSAQFFLASKLLVDGQGFRNDLIFCPKRDAITNALRVQGAVRPEGRQMWSRAARAVNL
jgi:hypothetical protein